MESNEGGKVESDATPRTRARPPFEVEPKPGEKFLAMRAGELGNPQNITGNLARYLLTRFPPERIADEIEKLLNAKHETKGGNVIEDNRAREGGVKLLLTFAAMSEARSPEMKTVDTIDTITARLARSPALAEAAQKLATKLAAGDVQKPG